MKEFPKISVITPSFNQGDFLEETILSVLGQGYPNLEYIVMDGGSTDQSMEILKKYAPQLAYWQSQKDAGQADAINAGFGRATGDILCWINSDDMLLPGALPYVAQRLDLTAAQLVFGNTFHFEEKSARAYGSNVVRVAAERELRYFDYIIQPSAFWTRKAWEVTGKLAAQLHYGFDWEWFLRARQSGVAFESTHKYLSVYRIHDAHKSGTGGARRRNELINIYRQYAGENFANYCVELCAHHEKTTEVKSKKIDQLIRKIKFSKWRKQFPAYAERSALTMLM